MGKLFISPPRYIKNDNMKGDLKLPTQKRKKKIKISEQFDTETNRPKKREGIDEDCCDEGTFQALLHELLLGSSTVRFPAIL